MKPIPTEALNTALIAVAAAQVHSPELDPAQVAHHWAFEIMRPRPWITPAEATDAIRDHYLGSGKAMTGPVLLAAVRARRAALAKVAAVRAAVPDPVSDAEREADREFLTATQAIACEYCGVEAGFACRSPFTGDPMRFSHVARVVSAQREAGK
ncbi:hypothetical protein D1871_10985 [Nakamurella silvestris]|nr:hypothetical protein D1871_10985 [Nakamurella silvestris]